MTNLRRGALAAVALLLLALLAGCGSSETKTVVQTVTVTETVPATDDVAEEEVVEEEPAEEAEEPADDGECTAETIGECVSDGQTFNFVDYGQELRLKTLAAKVVGVTTKDSVGSDFVTETADGVYVSVAVTIRNRGNGPQSFGSDQATLFIGDKQYAEDFDAENGADEQSLLWQTSDGDLQPGQSITGNVIFDVPVKAARKVSTDGGLAIVNFGSSIDYDPGTIGVLRLARR